MIQATNNRKMGARSSGGATRFGGYALATDDPQLFNSRRPLPCWPASAGSPPSASWQLGRGLGLDRFSFVRLSAFVAARPLQTLCPLDHLGCNRSDPAENHRPSPFGSHSVRPNTYRTRSPECWIFTPKTSVAK